jgi:RNA polymerase sigma-70 factor (ECF subfamily)
LENLVEKAKCGNKNAFTELIMLLEDELYKIAKIRLQNENDVIEAVQETMISAYNSIKNLKEPNYFKTWIIKILINKCNDIYAKNSKKEISLDSEELKNYNISNNSNFDNNLNFYSIISCLNYDERIAIILYYMEGYKTKEIAEILSTNENTIKTRISRAKDKIKSVYKGDC